MQISAGTQVHALEGIGQPVAALELESNRQHGGAVYSDKRALHVLPMPGLVPARLGVQNPPAIKIELRVQASTISYQKVLGSKDSD